MECGQSVALGAAAAAMNSPALAAPALPAARMRELGQGASAGWLSGGRLFLCHGPINLVLKADGDSRAVAQAYDALLAAFPHWLGALVAELPVLRAPVGQGAVTPDGPLARQMSAAAAAFPVDFVTPMAGVAGAVADAAAAVLTATSGVRRVWVNNGGDIALSLQPGQRIRIGIVPELQHALRQGSLEVSSETPVRGVATSGWQGRSHSLGIADAVTVLARDAVHADVAATLIANAVYTDSAAVRRTPAAELDETSDLGERPVTTHVGTLSAAERAQALHCGETFARTLLEAGLIEGAALCVQRDWRIVENGEHYWQRSIT